MENTSNGKNIFNSEKNCSKRVVILIEFEFRK